MYKRKISAEDKIYAVNLYLNGKESHIELHLCLMSTWLLYNNGFVITNPWVRMHL